MVRIRRWRDLMSGIMGMILGSGGDFSLSMSPGDQFPSGTASTFDFSSETISVNGFAGGATYNWVLTNQLGGTFSVLSGQGTNTATVRVTGVPSLGLATATVECTVTIGGISKTVTANLQYSRTI